MSGGRHLLLFAALAVNLWVAGDLIAQVAGPYVRGGFEMALIFAYLHFVWDLPRRVLARAGPGGSDDDAP